MLITLNNIIMAHMEAQQSKRATSLLCLPYAATVEDSSVHVQRRGKCCRLTDYHSPDCQRVTGTAMENGFWECKRQPSAILITALRAPDNGFQQCSKPPSAWKSVIFLVTHWSTWSYEERQISRQKINL